MLEVVSTKTGYPTEMLELDQDMEADLGIDTVKQAETFASIRESFDIPVQEGLNLRDYPTLQSVIDFVRTNRPELAEGARGEGRGTETVAPISQSPNLQSPGSDPVVDKVLQVVSDKTGYPTEMLELDQDMEADLGIDTVKQAETFASIRESFAIPVQEGLNLRDYPTLQSVIDFVRTMRPELAAGARGEGRGATPAGEDAQSPTLPISNLQSPVSTVKTIGTLEDADKMPRRVPQPALRPSIDLCKPTGVTIDAAAASP